MRNIINGLAVLIASGCASGTVVFGTPDESELTTSTTSSITTSTETTTATTTSTQTTSTTTTTAMPDEIQVADVAWEVHDQMGSIIVVSWEQLMAADANVEYSFDEGVWESSPVKSLSSGYAEEILLGIPYDSDVSFRVVNHYANDTLTAEEISAHNDAMPGDVPVGTVLVANESDYDSEAKWFFTSMSESDYWAFIFDRKGRVVFAVPIPSQRMSLHVQPSHDRSTLLIDHNSFWALFDGGESSQVERVQIDGTVVDTYDTPRMHHPFTEMSDGAIAYGAASEDWFGFGNEETLRVAHTDGSIETVWSCEDWVSSISGAGSTCGSNTLFWDESSGHFVYSMYSLDTVIEIDYATGSVVRYFGDTPNGWSFDPPSSQFWWQHGGHYTDAGTFMTSTKSSQNGNETLIREYDIDEESETLVQIWSFGEGEGLYGDTMGEAHRLPNGNTLHNYGDLPRIREVTPDGDVVWDVEWNTSQIGRSEPLYDLYNYAP